MLLEQTDDILRIGITGAQTACEPVAATIHNRLGPSHELELPFTAGLELDVDTETLLDKGCETRSLAFVTLSRRTVVDLDTHGSLLVVAKVVGATQPALRGRVLQR